MAEFIQRQIKLGLSKTTEAVYNTPVTGPTNFYGAISTSAGFAIPTLEKLDDLNKVGTGHEFATYLRSNYWSHSGVQLGDELNTDLAAVCLARAFGGDITTTEVVPTELYQHVIKIQSGTARQLPGSTIVSAVGRVDASNQGASFIYPGCVPEQFSVSQDTQAAVPGWTCDFVGSGKYTQLDADITGVPDTTFQNYVHGAAVTIVFNDGTAVDLTSPEQRVRSWSFVYNNNLRRDDRRPGDPFRVAGDPDSGAYVNRLMRGARSCGVTLTVALNETMREFVTHRDNAIITGLKITALGSKHDATNQHTFEIELPKSYMRSVTPTNDNDDASLQLEIFPVKGTGEYVQARVISILPDLS